MSQTLLKKASVKQLENELIKRRAVEISALETQKSLIDQKIKQLSSNLATPEKARAATNGPEIRLKKSMHKLNVVKNDKSLKDLLMEVAADGQEHSTQEFLTTLETAGWKTTSSKPYYVVASGLADLVNQNILQRVSKGRFTKTIH